MKPRTRELLALLEQTAGWLCARDLVDRGVGFRYGARIGELRKAGFSVETAPCKELAHHHEGRVCRYRLVPSEQLAMETA